MLHRTIDLALDRPLLVVAGLFVLIAAGVYSLLNIPVDAFPDLTNNQVTVVTDAQGMAVLEVEQLVTFPLESAVMGLPDTLEVRSVSKLGLSVITVVFEDDIDVFLARQLVTERLAAARDRIPVGLEPQLGPLATPFGEVYQYTLEADNFSAMELKTLHDWEIKYRLRAVPGVADVNTWGGFTRQYEIVVDPKKLRAFGVGLRDVYDRVAANNANFSGGFVEHAGEQYTVRGVGRATTVEDLEAVVVKASAGAAVRVADVAEVRLGGAPRQGAVTQNNEGETLSGMVIMLKGQNSDSVIKDVKETIASIRRSLPDGVEIVAFYDQSEVIDGAIRTVRNNLLEGAALVIAVLFFSLGQIRAAILTGLIVPLSLLSAFIGMRLTDITANLMSLGAVDFGVVIDGAVVVVDNCVRRLEEEREKGGAIDMLETVRSATHEVATPVLSGVVIVLGVYIPILTLEGLEGRMFQPMAITVCAAVLAGLVLALYALPSGCRFILKPQPSGGRRSIFDPMRRVYRRVLDTSLDHRKLVAGVALVVISSVIVSTAFLGAEFMPRLDEGSILIETFKPPSVSVSEAVEMNAEVERVLLEIPEVTRVVSRLGRPDFATEAMGVYQTDVYVNLRPREEWTTTDTKEGLIDAMSEALENVPGIATNFTQPMAMRLDETVSGVRADLAIKLFGDDSDVLEREGDRIAEVLRQVPGAADVQRQVYSGAAEWRVDVRRDAIARFGLNVEDVRAAVEAAIQGLEVTEIIEGRRRFRAVLRFPESVRKNVSALGDVLLRAPGGELVRLADVADVVEDDSPESVSRENSQRRLVIQSNVRGRDLGSFVADAQEAIAAQVDLPNGYFLEWGGQFENQERAMGRLALITPAVLLGIFFILYSTFGSVGEASLVMMLAPFAAVGGTLALWLRDMPLSVSASIGYIAVFGVAILDGLVLVSTINRKLDEGLAVRPALVEAATLRLRPVIMTSVVAAIGFLPMALATSTGAEVQRPLATVVIGGLVTSTTFTLLLTPTLFPWFSRRTRKEAA